MLPSGVVCLGLDDPTSRLMRLDLGVEENRRPKFDGRSDRLTGKVEDNRRPRLGGSCDISSFLGELLRVLLCQCCQCLMFLFLSHH